MVNITKYETSVGVRWRVRYRKPNGRQSDKRGFARKIDAQRWAAENITVAQMSGTFIDPAQGRATVKAVAAGWLAAKKIRLKPKTYDTVLSAYRTHVVPAWGAVKVSDIQPSEVQKWVNGLCDGSASWDGKPKSASTVLTAEGILHGILDYAVREQRLAANPCSGLVLPRKQSKRHMYLSFSQLIAVASHASKSRSDQILTLGLTGLRFGEMAALRVRDVDFTRSRILVERSVTRTSRGMVETDPKTHERRTIVFPHILESVLKDLCKGKGPDDLVFQGPGGGYVKVNNASKSDSSGRGWFRRALEDAGITDHMTVHDLRHTAASLMVHAGANVKAIQRQLGHASAAMTLDVYADLFDSDLDEVRARLDGLAENFCGQNVGSGV